MTDNSDKIRSIVLAALMVFSVFAGTVAFAGTAAAAGNGSFATPDSSEQGADTNLEASFTVDSDDVDNNDHQEFRITFSGASNFDNGFASDIGSGDVTVSSTGASLDGKNVNSVEVSNEGATLDVTLDSSATLDEGDTITITVENSQFQNPSDDATYTGHIVVSPQSSYTGDSASADLEVTEATSGGAGTPSDVSANSAVHFDNDTSDSVTPVIEIAFESYVDLSGGQDFVVNFADGTTENVTETDYEQTDDGRVVLTVDELNSSTESVTVPHEAVGTDSDVDVDVTYAPVTVDASNKNSDVSNTSAYIGSNVVVRSDKVDKSFDFSGNVYSPTRGTGDHSKVFVIDTDDFSEGLIEVDTQDDGDVNAKISMETLGLSVSADDVKSDTDVTGTVEADDINRPIDVALVDSDDDVVDSTQVNLGSSGNADFTLANQSAGNYTVVATDVNTGVEATTDVNVTAAAEGAVTFTNDTYVVPQGGIANITLDVVGTTEGSLVIGQNQNSGYQANVTFVDEDEDGEVTIQFNSYEAGNQNAEVVNAAGEDTATLHTHTDLGSNDLLAEGGYDLAAVAGHESNGTKVFNSGESDFSSLGINPRSTDEMVLWTAPSSADADELLTSVTEDSTIASGDWVVHQVSATGLDGLVDSEGGLSDALDNGVNVTVEQTEETTRQNRQPKTLDVTEATEDGDLKLIADAENDSYYIALDTSTDAFERVDSSDTVTADGLSASTDEEFISTFTVYDEKLVGGTSDSDHESVNATFEVVAGTASLDETPVNVTAETNQTISGTSTLAPGTEIQVTVQSTDDTSPRFYNNPTATVQDDGTWNITMDFDEQSTGDTFSVSAGSYFDADGNVVESTTEATPTATPEPDTETATPEPDTETATPEPDTETPEDDTTTTTTPGFGVAVALVALLAAALLAGRRE
ncbi:PGF-CTERM sorting domain-containing protein [Halolamina sp. R1-12]|uniref:DUF7827 domain-containing protein n=1 Tax=Halolamina sp. R1-12 TaxID=2715752 RepID=UPI0018849AA8|nr:BGTF surface domain-containing protein [Halolamina sp. R1-12]NHX36302.1 PGF-CTERM sorting domain-containing protein [Halolamina sp. R1-12]